MCVSFLVAAGTEARGYSGICRFDCRVSGVTGPFALFVGRLSALDDAEDLVLAEDHEVLVVEADLAAGVLADEDAVALLDAHRRAAAVVVDLARADGDHLGLLRLLLGGVGDDDPPANLLFGLDALDQDPVVQRTDAHCGRDTHVVPPPDALLC